jgi:hypothetical protein
MALTYQPLDEKDDVRSNDGESQDTESLLGTRKPSFISFKSNIFWIVLHVLVTLGLLIGLRVQSEQKTDAICPKLLPLELRKSPCVPLLLII